MLDQGRPVVFAELPVGLLPGENRREMLAPGNLLLRPLASSLERCFVEGGMAGGAVGNDVGLKVGRAARIAEGLKRHDQGEQDRN